MTFNKNAFIVGVFVLVGLGLAIFTVIWLGMSNYLEEGQKYVAYFNESVQGLDRDSAVKYRGVSIGKVQSVGVAPDGVLIEVIMNMNTELKPDELVGQLKTVGITGIMFIELDRYSAKEVVFTPEADFDPPHPVIPTKASDIKVFMEGVDEVLQQIRALDAQGISTRLKASLDKFNRLITQTEIDAISADIKKISSGLERALRPEQWKTILASAERSGKSLEKTLKNANQTIVRLDKAIAKNEKPVTRAFAELSRSADQVEKLLAEGTRFLKNSDGRFADIQRYLIATLQNLEKASQSLTGFVELISDRPSRLIFGEPVPTKEADINAPNYRR